MASNSAIELVSCVICTEQFRDAGERTARSLRCGHTLCTGCLELLLRGAISGARACPSCREPLPPGGDVGAFARNYAIEAVAGALVNHQGDSAGSPKPVPLSAAAEAARLQAAAEAARAMDEAAARGRAARAAALQRAEEALAAEQRQLQGELNSMQTEVDCLRNNAQSYGWAVSSASPNMRFLAQRTHENALLAVRLKEQALAGLRQRSADRLRELQAAVARLRA